MTTRKEYVATSDGTVVREVDEDGTVLRATVVKDGVVQTTPIGVPAPQAKGSALVRPRRWAWFAVAGSALATAAVEVGFRLFA